jgi:hypothetical protein
MWRGKQDNGGMIGAKDPADEGWNGGDGEGSEQVIKMKIQT